jgi:hypothetical protein
MANLLSLKLGWRDVTPLFAAGNTPPVRLRQALDAALTEARGLPALFTSTEVVYGVTGTDVTGLPECGVSP